MSKTLDQALKAAFLAGVMHGVALVTQEPKGISTMQGIEAERENAFEAWRRRWAGLEGPQCPRCGTDLEKTEVENQVWCPTCKETGEVQCTCFYTDPKYWPSAASMGYGSGYEPGSQMEWNPDCPVHPAKSIDQEREEVRTMLTRPDGTCGYDGVMHDPADHLPKQAPPQRCQAHSAIGAQCEHDEDHTGDHHYGSLEWPGCPSMDRGLRCVGRQNHPGQHFKPQGERQMILW